MSKAKILIVDDNHDAADALTRLVNKMGHDARACYSGTEAINAGDFGPDFIFMDIDLGDTSGYDVAKTISLDRRFSKTKLVALTGYSQEEDKQRAYQAGFHYHLSKPVGSADLDKILKSATI